MIILELSSLLGGMDNLFNKTCGKTYSWFGNPPSAGTKETIREHLHFIWDTLKSLLFHLNYICYSFAHLPFTSISFVGHSVSKVSSECFIIDLSVHGAGFYEALTIMVCI